MTTSQTPAAATARAILNTAIERETEDLYRYLTSAIKLAADKCCTRMHLEWRIVRHDNDIVLDTSLAPEAYTYRVKIFNAHSINRGVLEQRLAEDDFTLEFANHPSLGLVINYIIWAQAE